MTESGLLFQNWALSLPHSLRAKIGLGNQCWGHISSNSRKGEACFPKSREKQARGTGSHLPHRSNRVGRVREALWDLCLKQEVTRGSKTSLPWRKDRRTQEVFHIQFKRLKSERVSRFKVLFICILTDLSNYIHFFQYYTYSFNFTNSHTHLLPFDTSVCRDQFPYVYLVRVF